MDPLRRLAEAEKQLRLARGTLGEPDVRQVDLWRCPGCSLPHLDVVEPRECSHCGSGLEYYGEVDYHNLSLVDGGDDSNEP